MSISVFCVTRLANDSFPRRFLRRVILNSCSLHRKFIYGQNSQTFQQKSTLPKPRRIATNIHCTGFSHSQPASNSDSCYTLDDISQRQQSDLKTYVLNSSAGHAFTESFASPSGHGYARMTVSSMAHFRTLMKRLAQ